MKTIKVNIKKQTIIFDSIIKESFAKPIIFYCLNYKSRYLSDYIITDFQNDEVTIIETYSDDNKKSLKPLLVERDHSTMMPHHSIINNNQLITSIFSLGDSSNNFFNVIDLDKEVMTVYNTDDFGLSHLDTGVVSETITKDQDEDCFYLSIMRKDKTTTEYYKFSYDLTKYELIFSDNGDFERQPHQVIKFKDYILSSGFNKEDGKLLCYNLKTEEINIIPGRLPAHIEIVEDIVYYVNNNIIIDEDYNVTYRGPAIVSKLELVNNKPTITKDFFHHSGFRYTSHKFMEPNILVCTGYPNRLFFVNTDDMSLIYYQDLIEKILPDEDVIDFISNPPFNIEKIRFMALEISTSNQYVILFDKYDLVFFNYKTKKIESVISVSNKQTPLNGGHCCYLE